MKKQSVTRKQPTENSAETNLKAALLHAALGYAVFPAKPDKSPYVKDWQKKATTDTAQIEKWFAKFPDAVPALPTGKKNGIAVLDVDRKKGKDGFKALQELGVELATLSPVECDTPSGGAHFYFAWPEGMGNSAAGLPTGVDIRGEGGFVIANGAVSLSGAYTSKYSLCDDAIGLPDWPDELAPKSPTKTPNNHKRHIAFELLSEAFLAIPNDNEDRDWWIRLGAALHFESGASAEGLELWHEWSAEYPGYSADATEAAWHSFKRDNGSLCTGATILAEAKKHGWEDASILDLFEECGEAFPLDEDGVIRAFTAKHKDALRFDHHLGAWYQFDGNVWRKEETRLANHYARELATNMAKADPKAKAFHKVNVWEAIERGARTVREFAITSADWNTDLYSLGTPGGTVDLRTGKLTSGNPDDLISRQTAIAPIPLEELSPECDCPRWLAFLAEALNEDAEAIRFLQQWAGYSLTGDTKEQSLVFVYGPGGSGKSTAINTIADVMGEYATNVASSTLTAAKHDAHPEELARLDGARLAWASETERGRGWAENRIKSLTGGDKITARHMRQNSFEFTPQLKLAIVGNNQPSLTSVDDAIKRRFIVLPFDHPPKSKDTDLPHKLQAEWPAILSWMIQGCLDWQANGLVKPEAARKATDAYFEAQDTVAQWLDDCCEVGDSEADNTSHLWNSWLAFCRQRGEDPGTRTRTFPETLSQRGFEAIKDTAGIRGRGYRGLSVGEQDVTEGFDDVL